MKIRSYKKSDAKQIARLYHGTIRHINRIVYSEKQVAAWASDVLHFRDWEKTLSQKTFVAEKQSSIVGFVELENDGHIGCFFSHKDYQRQGIGSALFDRVKKQALKLDINQLTADVSITVKPFFTKLGFVVVEEQQIKLRGETLTNYRMSKKIPLQ